MTAYGSLGSSSNRAKGDEVAKVAQAHGVSSAALLLRWALNRGVAVIPGATSAEHIRENLALPEVKLSTEEIARISSTSTRPSSFKLGVTCHQSTARRWWAGSVGFGAKAVAGGESDRRGAGHVAGGGHWGQMRHLMLRIGASVFWWNVRRRARSSDPKVHPPQLKLDCKSVPVISDHGTVIISGIAVGHPPGSAWLRRTGQRRRRHNVLMVSHNQQKI